MSGERTAEDLIEKPDVRRRASPGKEQSPREGGCSLRLEEMISSP